MASYFEAHAFAGLDMVYSDNGDDGRMLGMKMIVIMTMIMLMVAVMMRISMAMIMMFTMSMIQQ